MDLSTAVINSASEKALLNYRDRVPRSEDDIDERSLCGLICVELHQLGFYAVPEVLCTSIASDLGLTLPPELRNSLQGWRADIAIYDTRRPVAIIELKIFSDTKDDLQGYRSDAEKCGTLRSSLSISAYASALVCETAKRTLSEQRQRIQAELPNYRIAFSDGIPSTTGEWMWCFACAENQPATDPLTPPGTRS